MSKASKNKPLSAKPHATQTGDEPVVASEAPLIPGETEGSPLVPLMWIGIVFGVVLLFGIFVK